MKKILSAIAVIFFLYSCTTQASDNSQYYELKTEVDILETRVDSLITALSEKQTIPTKKSKKSKATATALSSYSSSSLSSSGNSSYSSNSRKSFYSGQCQARTKKGYQCSRNARSGGYCWQHGG